jgi:hypothetical protein
MFMRIFDAIGMGNGVLVKVIDENEVLIFENQYIKFVLNIITTLYFFYGLSACESV